MKKLLCANLRFAIRMVFGTGLIMLAMLPVFSAAGQEKPEESVPAPDVVIEQLVKYSNDAAEESLSPDSALNILSKAITLAKKYKQRATMAYIWRAMGDRKLEQRDFAGCQRYLDSAFAVNVQLKDPEVSLDLNMLAATMYKRTSNYAKAASCYFRAVQAVEENEIKDDYTIATMYNNLALFMYDLDEKKLARKYLLLAKRHVVKMQPVDSALLINILVMTGDIEMKTDSIAAMNYFKDAYALASKFSNNSLSHIILINLSMGYTDIHQYDTAAYFLDLAKTIIPPDESRVAIEMVEGMIASGRKEYTTAEMHLLRALKLINNEPDDLTEMIYKNLSEVYAARREYQKAYAFHTKYLEQYELHKGNAREVVADFMLGLQAIEHEKTILQKQIEISSSEAAIKKQRFWIAAMCLVSGLLCVILVMAYRNYHNKKSLMSQQMHTLLQSQEIERLKAEAEGADNERTRIAYDLHDGVMVRLANVKINLNGLPVTHPEIREDARFQDIVTQVDTAARELRNTAHNLMPEILLEDGVAQAIFYFCKTTEQASGLNIKFQQIGQPLPRLQIQVETAVYRIVQGLVQNVIQHAKATTALVQLQYAERFCSVTVEDNGQGIPARSGNEGYGLKSIRNRIKILGGTFDIKSDKEAGTTAYLEFDVLPFLRKEA